MNEIHEKYFGEFVETNDPKLRDVELQNIVANAEFLYEDYQYFLKFLEGLPHEKIVEKLHERYTEEELKLIQRYKEYEQERSGALRLLQIEVSKVEESLIDMLKFAEMIHERQPYFFDRTNQFWLWDGTKYVQVDDTDILNIVLQSGVFSKIPTSKIKTQIIDAFKVVGRRHIPQEPPLNWIQFGRWVYDIETGARITPDPKFFFTNPIPWEVGQSEETPMLDELFEMWVGPKNKKLLYEIIAYSLYRGYPIHRFFILYGQGSNGKSQFIGILKRFLGINNVASIDFVKFTRDPRFEVYNFYKKLVVTAVEIPDVALQNTGMLKALTGGDPVEAEKKFKMPFTFINYAKLIVSTNALPVTKDKSYGFYRRTLIIEFPNTFERGKDIYLEIPDHEFENLAKKSLRILKELLERGKFTNEEEVEEKMRRYEALSNPLILFIESETEKGMPDDYIPLWEFLDKLSVWLLNHGYRSKLYTKRNLKGQLQDLGYEVQTIKTINEETGKETRWAVV